MYSSAFRAIGHSATVTIKKINVNAAKTSAKAISLGVRWRMAPSTSAIIRSRNEWPASAVISTTMRSDSTRGSAGHAGAVAARFANHRRALAGDGRLIDGRNALDDLTVAGDDLSRFDDDVIAGL